MADTAHRRSRIGDGRVLGWISGLGFPVAPWLAAGIVSTFLPDPEASFPWVLLAAFAVMVGWVAYGIARVPRFAKGALSGAAIAATVVAALALLVWMSRP